MPVLPTLHGLTEHLRERICSEPSDVLRELEAHLQTRISRSDRLRLLGLGLACCRNLGDFRRGNELVGQADDVGPVRHPMAQADFALQLASYRIATGDRPGALQAVTTGLEAVEVELQRPRGASKASRQRRAWFVIWAAGLRVVRGEIAFLLGGPDRPGELREAFRDVLEILGDLGDLGARGWTGRNLRRLHIGTIVLLSFLLTEYGPVEVLPAGA